jgi:hypothetical protein
MNPGWTADRSGVCLRVEWDRSGELAMAMKPVLPLGMLAVVSVVATSNALAQQPVRPLPKVGGCPVGYYSSGDYCVPSKSGNSRGAIEKVGNGCPIGFYASGNYCLSSPSNQRGAIEKEGNSCPIGWYSSGSYCVTND